jgi:hypothetical protein
MADLYGTIEDEDEEEKNEEPQPAPKSEDDEEGAAVESEANPPGVSVAPERHNEATVASPLSNTLDAPPVASPVQQLDPSGLVAAPNARLKQMQEEGSGVSHKHGFGGALLKGLDIAGSILTPNVMPLIPGTTFNHNLQLRNEQAREANDQASQTADLAQQKTRADIDKTQEETKALKNKPEPGEAKTVTAGDKVWQWNPDTNRYDIPVGSAKEAPHYEKLPDGTVISMREQNGHTSSEVVYKGDPKVETDVVTRVVGGVPHAVLVNKQTGTDIKDLGQTKVPGENPDQRRSAAELTQVEREARGNIQKAATTYLTAKQRASEMTDFINAAKSGNKAAQANVPLEGALDITTSQGVKRINRTEVEQYAGAGSLFDKISGEVGKLTAGKPIPDNVLDDMKQLSDILNKNAYKGYSDTHDYETGITKGYGIKDFEKRVPKLEEPKPGGNLPDGGGKKIDVATAKAFLKEAGGDKAKAAQLAKQKNWVE